MSKNDKLQKSVEEAVQEYLKENPDLTQYEKEQAEAENDAALDSDEDDGEELDFRDEPSWLHEMRKDKAQEHGEGDK